MSNTNIKVINYVDMTDNVRQKIENNISKYMHRVLAIDIINFIISLIIIIVTLIIMNTTQQKITLFVTRAVCLVSLIDIIIATLVLTFRVIHMHMLLVKKTYSCIIGTVERKIMEIDVGRYYVVIGKEKLKLASRYQFEPIKTNKSYIFPCHKNKVLSGVDIIENDNTV